jgi:enediyne biosynthesis protein E4
MNTTRFDAWTRRRVLKTIPAGLISALVPGWAEAAVASAKLSAPYSRFVDVAQSAGLHEAMIYGDPDHVTYVIEDMGGGCAFLDYDNDGWMDVFLLCGQQLDAEPPNATNRLYKNNRDGTFTDVTAKAGLVRCGWANGVCVGDYDNDGNEDLFVTYYGHNRLYHNNGDGTFTDVTVQAGLHHKAMRFGSGCTFVDYNRDGLLDLFVSNYVDFELALARTLKCTAEGMPVNCNPGAFPAPSHYLYRNNGDGTFTDVSKESGIAAFRGSYGLSAVALDVDEDGWQDIFVACDASPSLLLMNNHDGTFREEGLLRGVALNNEGEALGGMGVGAGDYTLDGHLDLIKTHFRKQATGIYRNNGKGEFEDRTFQDGLGKEKRFISWGTGFADFDNDGYPDIFVASGTVYPELSRQFSDYFTRCPRLIFRNLRNGTFEELGDETGPGIAGKYNSRGCAFGDFDNDGDLDVLVLNMNEPPSLLRNDVPPGNHWIKVRLEGTKSNRSAIGARVVARYDGKVQAQSLQSQTSYLSANDPRLHFGLGAATSASVDIYWPSGAKESYADLKADQLVTIREGQGIVKGRPFR